MHGWKRIITLIGVLVVLAAACGDDDDDAASDTTQGAAATATASDETSAAATAAPAAGSATTAPASGGSPTTAASDLVLDEPVLLVGLYEIEGESPLAINNLHYGAQLAVDEINEGGGIGGRPLEYVRIPTSPLDPAAAEQAVLEAFDMEPTAVYGPVSSAVTVPLAGVLSESGIPIITATQAPAALLATSGATPVANAFHVRPFTPTVASDLVEFAVERFSPTTVGLLCVEGTFGEASCNAVEAALADLGIEVCARRNNAPTATDLTEQVRAMDCADVVIDFNFPNPTAVASQQLVREGIAVPHIGPASIEIAFSAGGVPESAYDHTYGIVDCIPQENSSPRAQQFVERYRKAYGREPNYASAESYDAVFLVKAAVEAAGTTDSAEVIAALSSLTHDGVCTTYATDEENVMNHQSVVHSLAGGKVTGEQVLKFG